MTPLVGTLTPVRVMLLTIISLLIAAPLYSQSLTQPARRASFTAGASFGDGDTALALSTGLGFPLSSRFGVEFELAYARRLDFTLDLCPPPLVCVIGGQVPVTGRTVSLVPHFVFELLPARGRVRAYAQAGAGFGHVRQRYVPGPPVAGGAGRVELTRSSATVAVSFGGGMSVDVGRHISVGAELRVLQLFDDEATIERFIQPSGTLTTVRAGSRITWGF